MQTKIELAPPIKNRKYIQRVRRVPLGVDNFLSVLEGLEGGFAILGGVIVGLSFTTHDRNILLVVAIITMVVNAFNSSAIRYSSQHYMDEIDGREKKHVWKYYFLPAITEFLVYLVVCGFVVLPLALLPTVALGIAWVMFTTIFILFTAGYYRGRLLRTHPVRDGMELSLLGTLIIVVGGIAGYTLASLT
jgi:VIT1/CCC1 family predicted Fe2+/Mn2+ transporter